ncbi:MAG TPA: LysR family transcriptional regulator [Solirubrobacteraceae bacterium]|jgi:DNA-binding transcriptional LysR family regulator|nr:LysR family transcriptional regulator [Solirubrobacteraceae bacterium]
MTLRQLEYLVAVVDEGSFGRAAQALYVSQPTLSQQVRALEAEVGGPLVERLARGVRPTSAGEALLPPARAALAAAARARRSARMVLGLEAGELEIATVGTVALGLLPAVLRRWRPRHRGRTVRVHEHRDAPSLAAAVADGGADLGIGPRPADWSGPLESLGWEELVVLLPPGDALRRADGPLALADLADREWVLFEREHALAQLVDRLCAAEGFTPRAAVRTPQIAAVAALAGAGLGPALVPANILSGPMRAAARSLDPPRARELCAFTRSAWSPLARAFLDVVAEQPWPGLSPGAVGVS